MRVQGNQSGFLEGCLPTATPMINHIPWLFGHSLEDQVRVAGSAESFVCRSKDLDKPPSLNRVFLDYALILGTVGYIDGEETFFSLHSDKFVFVFHHIRILPIIEYLLYILCETKSTFFLLL